MMKYIPQSREDEKILLDSIGLHSTEDLFAEIPSSVRMSRSFAYPQAQSEADIRRTFETFEELSRTPLRSFAGAGIYSHDIPSIVPFLQGRSEFATSYTPYQPEISQGTLQAIFEFQSLVCQLTECELSNASVYDGATALAEAVLMGLRIQKKSTGKILVSSALHPFYEEVINTYCSEFSERLAKIPLKGDRLDLMALEKLIQEGADIVVTQSPNIFGSLEDDVRLGELVSKSKAIWVTSTMEPFCWGVLRGPGAFGAHIVTAEGQSFGNAAYLGGSSYGIFATKNEYLRNLPGRLVGETVDQKGRRSYTLTFATREQFIRRDKATSNICTNQNLNMLAGLIHLITMGKSGIKEVAVQNLSNAEYLKKKLRSETNAKISTSATFNEFTIELPFAAKTLMKKAADENWIAGVDLGRFKDQWSNKLLVHTNELHRVKDLDAMVEFLRKNL